MEEPSDCNNGFSPVALLTDGEFWGRLALALVSVAVLWFAYPPELVWWAGMVGLVPWIWASVTVKGPVRAFVLGTLTGLIFFAMTIHWLAEWGLRSVFLLSAEFSVLFGIWSVLLRNLWEEGPVWAVFGGAAGWVAIEMLNAQGLYGIPTNPIAQSQLELLPIVQFIDLTGQWGLSFLVIAVNLGLAWAAFGRGGRLSRGAGLALPGVLVAAALAYGHWRLPYRPPDDASEQYQVSVVQGGGAEYRTWTPDYVQESLNSYLKLTRRDLGETTEPDLIIFPESSIPLSIPHRTPGEWIFTALYELARDYEASLVFGASFTSEPIGGGLQAVEQAKDEGVQIYNGMQAIGPYGSPAGSYLKLRPVPFGETQPLAGLLKFTDFPFGEQGYDAGKSLERLITYDPRLQLGTSICYENLYPYISLGQVRDEANLLINPSNYSWYEAPATSVANLPLDILRAVEHRRYWVRASTDDYSQVVDWNGEVTWRNRDPEARFAETVEVRTNEELTVYSRVGSWFKWFVLLGLGGVFLTLVRRSHERRRPDWEVLDQDRIWP